MKTSDVLAHFGGSKAEVARALGIAVPSIYDWRERPPLMRQIQLEALTKGALRADPVPVPTPKAESV